MEELVKKKQKRWIENVMHQSDFTTVFQKNPNLVRNDTTGMYFYEDTYKKDN